MSGFSKLAGYVKNQRCITSLLFNKTTTNSQLVKPSSLLNQIRSSSGRSMFIRPGKFYTKKYYDLVHFYLCIGGLPLLAFICYQNYFIGPATLTETPEGYEPRYWEYEKYPVKRFLLKYFFPIPEQQYEISLSVLYEEECKTKMRKLERKVEQLMSTRQDYKAWFYTPVNKEQEYFHKYQDAASDSKGWPEGVGKEK